MATLAVVCLALGLLRYIHRPPPVSPQLLNVYQSPDTELSDHTNYLKLPPNTATYYDSKMHCKPEILIVGDSIARHLILLGAITY